MPGSGNAGGSSNPVVATKGTEYDQFNLQTGGEAHQVEDIGDTSSAVIIRSHDNNAGKVYIGWDENVNDTNGFYLSPDEFIAIEIDIDSQPIWLYPVNDNEVMMFLAVE